MREIKDEGCNFRSNDSPSCPHQARPHMTDARLLRNQSRVKYPIQSSLTKVGEKKMQSARKDD